MKKYIFILLLCFSQSAVGQELFPLEVVSDSFNVSLEFQEGNFLLKSKNKKVTPGQILKVESIDFEDGGLSISYLPDGVKPEFSYHIGLTIIDESGKTVVPNDYQIGGVVSAKGTKKKGVIQQKIFWYDLIEGTLFPDKNYTLVVTKSLLGIVDCDKPRPVFKQTHMIQHSAVGALGLGLLSTSIIFHQQKKNNFKQYEALWSEGATNAAAVKFYEDAESARKTAQWTSISGTAILLADAGWFYFRLKKLRKKQEIYDRFCADKNFSFLIPKPIYYPDAAGGLALRWNVQF